MARKGRTPASPLRLTGWRIDIKSETQLAEEEAGYANEEWAEGEWVEDENGEMVWKPAEGGEAMSAEEWTHQAEDGPGDDASTDGPVTTDSPVATTDSPAEAVDESSGP